MIDTYCVYGFDFMGYKLSKHNPYSYHHIVKKENGGNTSLENGAILTKNSHNLLHIIEYREYQIYITINQILRLINISKQAPTKEYLKIINDLLEQFESIHEYDINGKGSLLLPSKYKSRIQKK